MTTRHKFVGARLRNIALRTGFFAGLSMSLIFVVWLWVANRVPSLQAYALARNIAAGSVTIALMAIPILRFRRQPVTMFVSGVTAWFLFTLTYMLMELYYSLLADRMGALHLFMMGAVCYGFLAVFAWVFHLCAEARHRYVSRSVVPAVHRRRSS